MTIKLRLVLKNLWGSTDEPGLLFAICLLASPFIIGLLVHFFILWVGGVSNARSSFL